MTDDNIRDFQNFCRDARNSNQQVFHYFTLLFDHYYNLDLKLGQIDHHYRLQIRKAIVTIETYRSDITKLAIKFVNDRDSCLYAKLNLDY